MSPNLHKLRLAGTFATLLIFGLGVGCTGFFVNPTISSLAVGPSSPTIETGSTNNTVQMTVFATNSDGSTANNPSVSWSITPTSTATINSTGLVTSVSVGTATVTAASNQNPSITGTQTVTVTVGCIDSIQVTPTSPDPLTGNNTTDTLTATASTCNGSQDVTNVATWNSSNTALATVAGGVVSEVTTSTTSGTVTITAVIGNITSNAVNISVTPGS
jgi:trimeric autotransporter adhesin